MPTSSTGRTAFTLVEQVVVVVIIVVLAGMIAPRLSGGAGSSELRESARRLLLTAQYARDFAAVRRRDCRIVLDSSEQRYALAAESDPDAKPGEFSPVRMGGDKCEQLGRGLRFGQVLIAARPRPDREP